MDIDGLRWKMWDRASNLPWVCPAAAYSKIIGGDLDASMAVGPACFSDVRLNGSCWCNKIKGEAMAENNSDIPDNTIVEVTDLSGTVTLTGRVVGRSDEFFGPAYLIAHDGSNVAAPNPVTVAAYAVRVAKLIPKENDGLSGR
jgi:hypothetical protein